MKILLISGHEYPAWNGGLASDRISDCLAKGLAELGHRVIYELPCPPAASLPDGIEVVHQRRYDVDIIWDNCFVATHPPRTRGVPWVTTLHSPRRRSARTSPDVRCNWIFVSEAHALSFGRKRFVYNAVDPSEFIFSETKDDYFLFAVADLGDLELKGFEIARALVRHRGIRLVVAGAISNPTSVERYHRMFADEDIVYVGHVSGSRKAQLFAGARALLFPTQANETFGLVVAEALMSGTPVICSDRGACPELVPPGIGFVCSTFGEYLAALENVSLISPLACRVFALEHYHYLRMARDYLAEFEKEIANWSSPEWRRDAAGCSRWVRVELGGRRFGVGVF
jgi:glycosyltransferase involved in cell wall biosynthesis